MLSDLRHAIACLVVLWVATGATGDPLPVSRSEFQKGVALGGWWRGDDLEPTLGAHFDALRADGVTWVQLTARWYQATRESTAVAPHADRSPFDASVRHAIRLARARGLRVFLKPQLDLLGDGWRGEIRMTTGESWRAWFASYTAFVRHYARLAREEQVELFAVAVELDATCHCEADWRAVINVARSSFPGPLTWAAN